MNAKLHSLCFPFGFKVLGFVRRDCFSDRDLYIFVLFSCFSFSRADLDAVKQCFQYTATVLTSTVAFQREQRLKNQTETLLKVAKNLFRQLGK